MEDRERIQQLIARAVATSPAGVGLCLVGGFRYRFLDQSARLSEDLDYHWAGDLAAKQMELLSLMNSRVLPEIRRQLGYESDARTGAPTDETDWLRAVHLAFWKIGVSFSRIEIPVEITRIQCHDPPVPKVANGTIYLTASDADMVESKVVALFGRRIVEHRDFLDVFIFSSSLRADSADRLKRKLSAVGISNVGERLASFQQMRSYHIAGIQRVLQEQFDSPVAANILLGGGGAMVLDQVIRILSEQLELPAAGAP